MTELTPRYPAQQYRDAAAKYRDQKIAYLYEQQKLRASDSPADRKRADAYDLYVSAMQDAADRHLALAEAAEKAGIA